MKKFFKQFQPSESFRKSFHITTIYALLGGVWIFLTDRLLDALIGVLGWKDTALLQTLRGMATVVLSSTILFFLLYYFLLKFTDQTVKRRTVEQKLRLYARAFENTDECIMITNKDRNIEVVNPAFCRTTGYSEEEVIGKNPRLLKSGYHDDKFYQRMFEAINQHGIWQGEIWNRRKNGEVYPQWARIQAIKDHHGQTTHYISVFTDISEQKESEEQVRFLAHHDTLTGLPNRLLFHERLKQALADAGKSKTKVAVMVLDLDRFKLINDTQGHSIGDQLLKCIAQRLKSCVGKSDTVARLGGDEFTLVIKDIRYRSAVTHIAQKILHYLSEPFLIDGQEFFISTSIGISMYPLHGEDSEALIRNADTAMYLAKEQGNNFLFYQSGMESVNSRKMKMEIALRKALENNEFLLHYQPQMDVRTGRICGFEALLRWRHPEMGMISPAEFIPLAEETGLILPIGEWVLRNVCGKMKEWGQKGYPLLKISINLSVRQFRDKELVKMIAKAVREIGVNPRFLGFEITESISMHQIDSIISTINELKQLGVAVIIDDFGKGHSSLSYLKQFPIDILKIDKSFVKHAFEDRENAAIVKAIIDMAHGLHLQVVAEGVEMEEELAFLKLNHCDMVQGYLISKPLEEGEVEKILREQRVFLEGLA